MKKIFLNCMMLCVLLSCSNQDISTMSDRKCKALQILQNEYNRLYGESRGNIDDLHVTAMSNKKYLINGDSAILIDSRNEYRDSSLVFDLEIIEFEKNNISGFSILSDDTRINDVLFITENGNIQDTAYIEPLKYLVEVIPNVAAKIITQPDCIYTQIPNCHYGPILDTKWGQGYPYNMYAPGCNCDECKKRGNHMPIGCVTTATAQYIANKKNFKSTFYGSKDLDFGNLPQDTYSMTEIQKKQISHFFHEIALCCQVKFSCKGSGSHIKSAYQYLKDLGYNCEYNTGNISFKKVKDEILSRNPHLISGAGDGSTGHMWVIDGISVVNGLAKYHCNWGWNGICDCWSIADPFTPSFSSPYYRRFRHIYTNSNSLIDNEVGEPLDNEVGEPL